MVGRWRGRNYKSNPSKRSVTVASQAVFPLFFLFPPCASPLERDRISSAGSSREIQPLAEKEDAEIQLFVRLLFQLLRSSIQLACRDCGRHDDCSITSGFNWWRPCLPLSAGASHFDWFYVRESRPITLARFHSPLFSFLSFLHSLLLLLLFWMRRRLMTWPQRQVADPPERTRWLRFCCYCCCGFIVVDHERRSTNSVVEQQKKNLRISHRRPDLFVSTCWYRLLLF